MAILKRKYWLYGILALVTIGLIFNSGCVQDRRPSSPETKSTMSDSDITLDISPDILAELQENLESRFGSLIGPPEGLRGQASIGIFWARPHPGPAIWNEIEKTQGNYEWEQLDDSVRQAHSLGINLLITIWPYADWDQSICHSDLPATPDPFGGILPEQKGIPCDWQSYQKFLKALVERYDGDGQEDMPGLIHPVNYFEIGNEPEMGDYNTFFQGSPSEYALLLKKSSEAIRQANPNARILNAGIASSADFSKDFWDEVFSQEGIDNCFDIANIHDLAVTSDGNVGFIKDLLKNNNIPDKPVWITEFKLYGGPGQENLERDLDEMENRIESAFSGGAEKIFLLLPPPPEMDEELVETLKVITGII